MCFVWDHKWDLTANGGDLRVSQLRPQTYSQKKFTQSPSGHSYLTRALDVNIGPKIIISSMCNWFEKIYSLWS